MTHLLFHLNSQLKITLIILLNKALQIHNIIHKTLIQSIFKHQPHHHLLKYKLQLILQLKLIQYKMYKLVQILTPFVRIHLSITPLQDIFLDLHYKPYYLIHYRAILQVQTRVIHNNLRQTISDPIH